MKNQPVTVTVRPDGSYYVEREKAAPRQRATVAAPTVAPLAAMQIRPVYAQPGQSPIAASITTTLKELAGIAAVAKAAVPALGKYGVVAAIGLGALSAWAESRPVPVRRFQLRRIKRGK